MTTAKVTERKNVLAPGFRWLRLVELTYVDIKGRTRRWESAERCHIAEEKTRDSKTADGVFICATINYSSRPPELLLVRQFRPPIDCEVVEFVAGLIDAGETPEQAALRELKEETGFSEGVTVRSVTAPMAIDPGMSNSCAAMVVVDIDGDLSANQNPVACPEEGEYVTPFRVPVTQIEQVLLDMERQGKNIDIAVRTYAFGWLAAHRLEGRKKEVQRRETSTNLYTYVGFGVAAAAAAVMYSIRFGAVLGKNLA
mmetsp:Transcript_35220/g.38964  ORF Transcript_35220/g.38964 Transcript_35220/m.38964 type:complete len:255 (+) Transcript_35220:192-956(+)|eukprot:CAMPEP_0194152314 /NCGR_PEP_ID=MMETSP0152-20130528/51805_1 /TAXON_ID=1049557 /ORGANISM="Thalassiothrix antarctica, Strain L6-D1" /LENGTH=254 /DNA_ID=CAMNT_0038856725 /DNA_START=131 /DNA_END=895 /DNA_ORIENTATION=-